MPSRDVNQAMIWGQLALDDVGREATVSVDGFDPAIDTAFKGGVVVFRVVPFVWLVVAGEDDNFWQPRCAAAFAVDVALIVVEESQEHSVAL